MEEEIVPENLSQLLSEVAQLLTGYSSDETWSEWDEQVRQRVIKYQYFLASQPVQEEKYGK